MAEESDVLQQAQDAAKARDYERALQLFDQVCSELLMLLRLPRPWTCRRSPRDF